jgi:hypothetical protein
MPFRDLNEEQFIALYKEILELNNYEYRDSMDDAAKILQLKVMFEIAKELRDLNRRLQDGIFIENPEEMQERIKKEVSSQVASLYPKVESKQEEKTQ